MIVPRSFARCFLTTIVVAWSCTIAAAEPPSSSQPGDSGRASLRVGFGEADITPELKPDRPVWIAGYGHGRQATGVHDPLRVRAVVLEHDGQRLALASADVVGLQYATVREIRRRLPQMTHVMVSSSHNHEAPDVIGIWGRTPFTSGVDPRYLDLIVQRTVQAVEQAQSRLQPTVARYGTASDAKLLGDSRKPVVLDDVLRVLRFETPDRGKLLGLLVQWNCHPEAMGPKNTELTADFPAATVAALRKRYQVPVAYFTGAVGGLMAPPDDGIVDPQGKQLGEGDFAYMQAYGEAVARLAEKAAEQSEPIALTPFAIHTRQIAVPLDNPLYKLARTLGVIQRNGVVWKQDPDDLSEPANPQSKQEFAAVTEVGYLQLGELHVACIPGEIYPELIYGKFQEPVEPNVDFPDAPLEPHVTQLLPGKKVLWFGLANDEIGYIIPRRQWDEEPPFAYGREKSQYGEVNSMGSDTAPIIMQALQRCVEQVAKPATARE